MNDVIMGIENELKVLATTPKHFECAYQIISNMFEIEPHQNRIVQDHYLDADNLFYGNDMSFRIRFCKKTFLNFKETIPNQSVLTSRYEYKEYLEKVKANQINLDLIKSSCLGREISHRFGIRTKDINVVCRYTTRRTIFGISNKKYNVLGENHPIGHVFFDEVYNDTGVLLFKEIEIETINRYLCPEVTNLIEDTYNEFLRLGLKQSTRSKYQRYIEENAK